MGFPQAKRILKLLLKAITSEKILMSDRLTSGSNRSLRSLGRAKARPLTKRWVSHGYFSPIAEASVKCAGAKCTRRAQDIFDCKVLARKQTTACAL